MNRHTAPTKSTPDAQADDRAADRIEERVTPRTPVIYETVRRQGEQEMARPSISLWWSGVAAGLSISFSLLAQAMLRTHLPDAPWRDLLTSLGYPVGFTMVVLSRQQLFTENTITVVLPLIAAPGISALGRGARMWGIVLSANLAGTCVAALLCSFTPIIDDSLRAAMLDISRLSIQRDWLTMGLQGVTAGFLMAAMVWILPAAGTSQLPVVGLMTYLIGLGNFSHIVAGSVEAFMLMAHAELGVVSFIGRFFLPVLFGNILGGTALFALISYAQVMKEI